MLSLQELSDRREIEDLMVAYCHAIDRHQWDELDAVFTPDAVIDYRVFGGPIGPYPEIKRFLADALPAFAYQQHIISTSQVRIDGDRATGRTTCTNPMGLRLADGSIHHMSFHLWYIDVFVRTADGWRIAERSEEVSHTLNVPEKLDPVTAQPG